MSLGLAGLLYRYRTSPSSLQAFESPSRHSFKNFVVYLGGLTDGLLACPYVESLASECEKKGWAFVQPIISSSYLGYGVGSLARDTEELGCLLEFLQAERGCHNVALIGHSTGCQNAVHFLAHAPPAQRALVRAAALQAPVSDREAANMDPEQAAETAKLLTKAEAMVAEQKGKEIVVMQYGFCPLSAERCISLMAKGGADDFFSSDFSDTELSLLLQHMSTAGQDNLNAQCNQEGGSSSSNSTAAAEENDHPRTVGGLSRHPGLKILVAFSMADDYVPKHVNRPLLVHRLVAAMQSKEAGTEYEGERTSVFGLELQDANHNLSLPPEAAMEFVSAAANLLTKAVD